MLESRFFFLFVFIIAAGLLYLLSPILTPFLLGALLAYLGDPIADRLEKKGMSRTRAVTVVFAVLILALFFIVFFLIPAISRQFAELGRHLPEYGLWIKERIGPTLGELLPLDFDALDKDSVQGLMKEYATQVSGIARSFLGSLWGSAGMLITFATYLFLTPVVTFYLLRDWDTLLAKIYELIPVQYRATVNELTRRSDAVLGGFIRGQMMVMLALGIIYAVGLSFIGLDMAIVIGMISGLVSFVPYLGLVVGIVLAGVMALLQFQDWMHLLGVAAVFGVAQIIESIILTPKFVGDSTGLHPVAVIFSVLAGGQLFGFMGILLALPAAAVINVFLSYFKTSYLNSSVYNDIDDNLYKLPQEQYIHHEKARPQKHL